MSAPESLEAGIPRGLTLVLTTPSIEDCCTVTLPRTIDAHRESAYTREDSDCQEEIVVELSNSIRRLDFVASRSKGLAKERK